MGSRKEEFCFVYFFKRFERVGIGKAKNIIKLLSMWNRGSCGFVFKIGNILKYIQIKQY